MCSVDDGEPWQMGGFPETRKARKAHACCECGRRIEPGETYEYVAGKIDGDFRQWKTCAHCSAAGSWLDEECNGHLFGGIAVDLNEHWNYGYEAPYRSVWLARAIVGMRRQWRTRRGALMQPLAPYQREEQQGKAA